VAQAYVAASLPRHGGVKPPLRYASLKGGATTATPAKPFTQEQVSNMVRAGLGDDSGAKPPEPGSAKKPINQVQVFALLAGQVPSHLCFRSFLNRCTDGVYC